MATSKARSLLDPAAHNPQIFCPCCSLPLVYRAKVELKRSDSARPGAQLFDCPSCGLFDSRGEPVSRRQR
jgi:predicted RNA-binding Zn-ribbon protein involved in translation (DUF1610 family)